MSVIELEEYLRDSLSRINSSDISSMYDGLQSIDALFGKLCAVSDPNNKRQPLSSISNSNNEKSSSLTSSRQNSESPNTASKLNESNDTIFEASASSTPSPEYTKNKTRLNKSLKSQLEKNRKVPNKKDPIFGQFLKTQDKFEFNITSNLLFLLLKMGLSKDYPSEFYTLTLKILQGCLLLHPDSRNLFVREMNMQLLLNLLKYSNNPEVIVSAIQTLVACLVRNIPNLRIFERLNGLEIICKLMKHKQRKISPSSSSSNSHIESATSTPLHNNHSSTPINKICSNFPERDSGSWRSVQVKAVEFLFFYLVPETRSIPDHIHESLKNSNKSNTKPYIASSSSSSSSSSSASPKENQENNFSKNERNAHKKSLSSSSSSSSGHSNSSSSLLSYNENLSSSSSSSSSISSKNYENSTKIYKDGYVRRTTSEKVDVLRQFLNKQTTDDLVKNLIENRPFGNMNIEW
ncbi:hypothetical protein B5S32_g5462 [[Candida] boidinii]|nr:hypothetical protein B5S32_g5462 [[Candida] boidinii]